MLRIEKDHKVGWLATHVSDRNHIWLFVSEIRNARGYEKLKVYFFFQIANKRKPVVQADKAIRDGGCFCLSAPPYQACFFHPHGHVIILKTAGATANTSAFQA